MKLLSSLLIAASLVLGTLAAATAYIPRLDAVDGSMRLTLNAPAGKDPQDVQKPLADPHDPALEGAPLVLTDALIDRLREQGVRRVRVKEFAFGRWDGRWLFALACAGLLLGAGLVRRTAAKTLAATLAAERPPSESPAHALQVAHDQVQQLRASLASVSGPERGHRIVETLDRVQRDHLDVVGRGTAELTARLGAAGYARLMDRFAAAERQLNRAWSAAADGVLDEAVECLERGEQLLEEAKARLEAP